MALHRPYIRQEVREEVERRAEKNEKGQFLDANTHEPIEGSMILAIKPVMSTGVKPNKLKPKV